MGVRAVGDALIAARGTMSQKAAAQRWGVPVATLAALERGVERNYNPQTLRQFDQALGGRDTWQLYKGADAVDALGEVLARLDSIDARLQACTAPGPLGRTWHRLSDVQRQALITTAEAFVSPGGA